MAAVAEEAMGSVGDGALYPDYTQIKLHQSAALLMVDSSRDEDGQQLHRPPAGLYIDHSVIALNDVIGSSTIAQRTSG